MAYATQSIVLISRAGIDIYTQAGKVTWKGFGSHSDTIGKCSDCI